MNRFVQCLALALPLTCTAACGEDSSPPVAPSPTPTTATAPTTTGITVTVPGPVRMGQTAQATGTETLSNGQSQAIATGWLSDSPAVAMVTTGGLVTGVGNGRATIYVIAGGRQGQQIVRVVPDYQGRWGGALRVTSCAESGVFADIHFCDEFPVGYLSGYTLAVAQTGEQMEATASYGPGLVFPAVSTLVLEDGSAAFSTSGSVTESGITLSIAPAFTIISTRVGELIGTVSEVWRFPNFNGEGRLVQEIVNTARSSSTVSSRTPAGAGPDAKHRTIERFSHRRR